MSKIEQELEFIKDILDDHKQEIEDLKKQITEIKLDFKEFNLKLKKSLNENTIQSENKTKKQINEVDSLKQTISSINNSLSELKEIIGKQNFQFPIPISNSQKSSKIISSHQIIPHPNTFEQSLQQNMNLEKFQILFILKQSKALSPQLAVSAKQLKDAFSIDKTVRTIHNKLDSLCREGFTIRIGKKPTLYFLSQEGLNAISKQERNVFSFTPQEY